MVFFSRGFRPIILNRGEDLYYDGMVRNIKKDGDIYEATVIGTHKYKTQVRIVNDKFIDGDCSCPYGENCKHMAALLYAIDNNDDYMDDEDLIKADDIIDKMDIEELRKLVKDRVRDDTELLGLVLKDSKPSGYIDRIDKILNDTLKDDEAIEKLELIAVEIADEYVENKNYDETLNAYKYILRHINKINDEVLDLYANVIFYMVGIYANTMDLNIITYLCELRDRIPYEISKAMDECFMHSLDYQLAQFITGSLDSYSPEFSLELIKASFNALGYEPNHIIAILSNTSLKGNTLLLKLEMLDELDKGDEFDMIIDKYYSLSSNKKELGELAIKRYRRINKLNKALEYLRNLFIETRKMKYFKESLELSSFEIEEQYYSKNKEELLIKIYDELNMLDKLFELIDESKSYNLLDSYYDKLSELYKDKYIDYYEDMIISMIGFSSSAGQYKRIARMTKKLLALNPGYDTVANLVNMVFYDHPKKKALHKEMSFLMDYSNKMFKI